MSGPLAGIKVVELAAQGPGPFAAMLLADLGAEVLRVDRAASVGLTTSHDLINRGRRSVAVDLKTPEGVEVVLRLAEGADALIEGFRPGVVERLGVGPAACQARNPRLVYGRMTGWGQAGPYARVAGHDINYLALSGTLHMIGRASSPPVIPVNLLGDYAGGGLLLAYGLVSGLLEAARSGLGQVIDTAMVDGAALLATFVHSGLAAGTWSEDRGTNLLDGGSPFYDVYETADGEFVAIGTIEIRFFLDLIGRLGLGEDVASWHGDPERWPELRTRLTDTFRRKTRDQWCAVLEGIDACFAPVLRPSEAPKHPHLAYRETFVEVGGVCQPAPAPRFSRTPAAIERPPANPGEHTDEALLDWGFSADEVRTLRYRDAIA